MKVLIIIPAYNEEKSIYSVVSNVKLNNPNTDIVVINDGSSDNTFSEAKRAGANVITLPQNLGIGGAVQCGYIFADRMNYDLAVQIDGDGQHDSSELSKLIDEMERTQVDMVIGSRFIEHTNYKPSFFRSAGIKYFSTIVSALCGNEYHDTTSGYRLVNREGIKLFAEYYPQDYPEVETIVYACRKGLNVREFKVNMKERCLGKSSITPVKSIYYIIKVTLATLSVAFSKIQ